MRFIHIADVHLGMQPDAGFPWSEERGEAIWESFRRIIRLAGREKTDFLLIAGDLFQCQPLLRELKEVNDLFASIPETIVVLIAGNHDYVKRESFYRGFDWADNVVMLLSPEPECVEVPEKKTAVYGCSYDKKEILENRLDGVRATLLQGMANIRADNNKKLDEIRGTVDEKLEATLQRRVSESFRAVSTQLEQVYKGLGEMQNLAADVGSLKQVLSGVKTRGILGEVQLGAILKEILAPGQYAENVATVPGSSNRVEYAVKLPGQSGTVWLPIDAKFPGDTYAHLQDAQASGDPAAVAAARRQLETVVRQEAKDIHDKYIEVPYTTAFGILFLPFEGLYAEVVNCGLPEILQRDYKINIAGPSTMAALLNALQMGFRTLAIQKRSGEVWQILGAVKTEFEKFGSGLQSMQRHLNQTGNDLEELNGTRSRAITRKLESVQQLEPTEAADLLGLAEGGSRISTQNSEIDRQDNAPHLRRKDDAGMPM